VAFVHDEWLDYGRWVDPWSSLFRGPRRGRLAPVGRLAGIPSTVHLKHAAHYVFVSDATRRQALDAGVEPARTSVAHSGIDGAFLDPAPDREWGWQLLYVGRLDPRKGVDTAVEALAHLPEEARLEIVGGWDAAEEQRLRALAASHGVEERVKFSGQSDRDQVFDAYGRADAVVFPVRWREPWGLVPLEAMARGRPVVATGRGGSGEYLRDGENCLLFQADDASSLAAALRRLADEPGLRRRLREGGLETAPMHTQATFNEAVEAAILSASST
jgi:glycosyltransferase involved in cell wall biosynthesis